MISKYSKVKQNGSANNKYLKLTIPVTNIQKCLKNIIDSIMKRLIYKITNISK